jgi:hypothetical protein
MCLLTRLGVLYIYFSTSFEHALVLDPYTLQSSPHSVVQVLDKILVVIALVVASARRCSFLPRWEPHALFCEMASQVRRRYHPWESFGGAT